MKEAKTYISYIKAIRNKDPLLRQGILVSLENSGFKPDLEELEELIGLDNTVKNQLFNESITIVLTVDSIAGHVYIEGLPIYDKDEKVFTVANKGFYPTNKKDLLYGSGELRTEEVRQETKNQTKDLISFPLSKKIMISQEQWEKLGYWVAEFNKYNSDLKYSLGASLLESQRIYHCAKFVDAALLHIGYVNGLGGIFTREEISAINDDKYRLLSTLLPPTLQDLWNSCNLETKFSDPKGCHNLSQLQIEQIEQRLQAGEKIFIRNAIQSLFDKGQELADKDLAELPIPSPRMVTAAFAGLKLSYELQNNFSNICGMPMQDVPEDQVLYNQAASLITNSHNLMDCAFAMGRMYNAQREQQTPHNKDNSSSSTPKPNL